jgi:hypothetical protein
VSCSGAGECASQTTCGAGSSPDWYSPATAGGHRGLDDPRWGTDPAAAFETTLSEGAGGYIILYNRETKQLAVSVRITLGSEEAPSPSDRIFFAITPNISGAPLARRLMLPLSELQPGAVATGLSQFDVAMLTDDWRPDDRAWVQNASAWRGGPGANLSWAVNFRADLPLAMIDPSKPFRVILTVELEHAPRELTTPAEAGLLKEMPTSWALATIDPTLCTQRVVLR